MTAWCSRVEVPDEITAVEPSTRPLVARLMNGIAWIVRLLWSRDTISVLALGAWIWVMLWLGEI